MLQNEWLIIFLIIVGVFLIAIKSFNINYFNFFMKSPFSPKVFNEFVYELNGRANIFLVLLLSIGISLTSAFLFQVKEYFELDFVFGRDLIHVFYIFIGLVILFIIKNLILRFILSIFKFKGLANYHILVLYLFNAFSGIILFPFLLMITYLDAYLIQASLWTVVFVLSILFLIGQFFIVQKLFRSEFSILSIIVYLCALEIAPLLVLFNTVVLLMN